MHDVYISKHNNNFSFLQCHVKLFGLLAEVYGLDLKDDLKDKPPNRSKTVKRILQTIKNMFFKEENDKVREACFESIYKIYENCFPNKKEIIFETLI